MGLMAKYSSSGDPRRLGDGEEFDAGEAANGLLLAGQRDDPGAVGRGRNIATSGYAGFGPQDSPAAAG